MEEESITDANDITVDTFSNASNTQRENASGIFTNEKLDKLDEPVDAIYNLTINDSKYSDSNTATASGSQGDITRNPETVTYTSNSKETVTRISNGNYEQKLLSNWTIPAVILTMNPRIDQRIPPILLAP